ncbi:MAG: CoA-binding protein [bacterium]|nr:CoA-binding protein [bacterium]
MDLSNIKKIAIVGATIDQKKFGNIVLKDLLKKGFQVIPVNPKYDIIEGLTTYKDVSLLPKDVDLIVFVVPPEIGIEELKKAYQLGFRRFWFQPGAQSEDIILYSQGLKDAEFSFMKCIMVETSR